MYTRTKDNSTMSRTFYSMESLSEFLRREVERTSYREVETKTKVSRGALENIIRKTNKDLPTIETLTRIAQAYDRKLWEVVQSVVDLELPQTPTERGQRMAAIVDRQPALAGLVDRLQALYDTKPDFVDGMLLAIEAMERQAGGAPAEE